MSKPNQRRFKALENCYIDDIYRHASEPAENDFTTDFFSKNIEGRRVPEYLQELDLISGKPLEGDPNEEVIPEELTVAELRKYAKSIGVKNVDSHRKEEILEKINLFQSDSGEGAGLVSPSDNGSDEDVA